MRKSFAMRQAAGVWGKYQSLLPPDSLLPSISPSRSPLPHPTPTQTPPSPPTGANGPIGPQAHALSPPPFAAGYDSESGDSTNSERAVTPDTSDSEMEVFSDARGYHTPRRSLAHRLLNLEKAEDGSCTSNQLLLYLLVVLFDCAMQLYVKFAVTTLQIDFPIMLTLVECAFGYVVSRRHGICSMPCSTSARRRLTAHGGGKGAVARAKRGVGMGDGRGPRAKGGGQRRHTGPTGSAAACRMRFGA